MAVPFISTQPSQAEIAGAVVTGITSQPAQPGVNPVIQNYKNQVTQGTPGPYKPAPANYYPNSQPNIGAMTPQQVLQYGNQVRAVQNPAGASAPTIIGAFQPGATPPTGAQMQAFGNNSYNPATNTISPFNQAQNAVLLATAPRLAPYTLPIAEAGIAVTGALNRIVPQTNIPGLAGLRSGFINIPSGIGTTITGAEYIGTQFNPANIQPGAATFTGITAMNAFQNLGAAFMQDPLNTAAAIIGPAIVLGGIGKGAGLIRGEVVTKGSNYISIEDIGIEPKYGFPVNTKLSMGNLKASFEQNTLVPPPMRMSIGETIPTIPTSARLPTDITGTNVMWTGWENTPKPGSTGLFTLGKGSSEIPGMYGAPLAESYFTKVGGQMPEVFGVNLKLIKSPAIVHTEVTGFEPTPINLRNVQGATDFSQRVPAGTAIFPGLKAEYEAVLGQGNILQIKPSNFFTKVGGFGESHFLGTKIPIIETVVTGTKENTLGMVKGSVPVASYEPYSPAPFVNLAITPLSGTLGLSGKGAISKPNYGAISEHLTSLDSYVQPSSNIYGSTSKISKSVVTASGITATSDYLFRGSTPPTSKTTNIVNPSLSPPSYRTPPIYEPPYYPPTEIVPPSITPPEYKPPSYFPPYYPPIVTPPPYSPPIIPPFTIPNFGGGGGKQFNKGKYNFIEIAPMGKNFGGILNTFLGIKGGKKR